MSSTSRLPNSASPSSPPNAALIEAAIARLRAEHEVSVSPTSKAVLLHEMAVLEEALGDDTGAARDQLAAVNTEPDFREPVERLVSLFERRHAHRNLGKLLERLVQIADSSAERARALLDHAAFLADREDSPDAAREALQQAAEETPDETAIWLSLELLAARLGDRALAERALAKRAELAKDGLWRTLLLLDLARLRSERGDSVEALEAIERAEQVGGVGTFETLLSLEKLAHTLDRPELEARALKTQAELIASALRDATSGNAKGVPPLRRTRAHAADAWLRAAELERARGEASSSTEMLDHALSELPEEPLLINARLAAAADAGDLPQVARLARSELERGATGELGAALWLRVARAALDGGEPGEALEAVQKALTLAPESVPGRALELDLLSQHSDPSRLATALEAAAEQLETDAAKTPLYLASAAVWARLAHDVAGAKAALSQAAMFGAAPGLVARVARLLAAVRGDAAWYEDSTRRLIAQGAAEDEHAGLWLELARARALRHEAGPAGAAFEALAAARGGSFLGNVLEAYAAPLLSSEDTSEDTSAPRRQAWTGLAELAATEADPEAARALRIVVALRALQSGNVDAALSELRALHEDSPADLVVSGALGSLLQRQADFKGARAVFARSAASVDDSELAAAFYLTSGMLGWKLGDRKRAVDDFLSATELHSGAASTVLGWALRAAEPEDAGARARALASLVERDPTLAALERFALEIGHEGSASAAEQALEALRSAPEEDGARAGELARALWAHGSDALATRREALESLAERSSEIAPLARAAHHQLELREAGTSRPHPSDMLRTSEAWARAEANVAPTLEWLSASIALGDVAAEVLARSALSARLHGPAASAVAASAALLAELGGSSRQASLDDQHAASRLARLELSPPGSDPGVRARALLQAAPDLRDVGSPMLTALAGFNQLIAGDVDGALASFRTVVEAYPDDVSGWEGLRASALARGDRATLAEASAALGDAVSDAALGARLWEEAASVLLDELGDAERGELALARAVERDIGRFSAFDRLFRRVRSRKDAPHLLDLIERRLSVAEDAEEIVKLNWERARALRESGDREAALAALEDVRSLEPEHVGALALTGEIYITLQRFEEAAEHLARLSRHSGAPSQQRLMSGVAAADLYEGRMREPRLALELLSDLYRAGLSNLPVRERIARTAAKLGSWEQATEMLEQLMVQRDTAPGRIDASRLAMVIYRDELGMPEAAQNATAQLLAEAPADAEALDLVLADVFARSVTIELLERGRAALVKLLQVDPMSRERVDLLARVARTLDNPELRQAALGVLVVLGADASSIDPELARLDQRVARMPRMAVDDRALPELVDPEDQGPVADLMRGIASTVAEALGPSLQALGVTKRERIDPRAGLPLRNELAAWAGALGIGEFELYVGGTDRLGICAVATETPALVVGAEVGAPLSPMHRQAVAREFLGLRRGTSVLRHRDPEEIHALIVAACRLAEVALPSPSFALLAEFQRQLGREMPRRVKKALPELARAVARSGQDPVVWYRAATSTLDRMAVIAAGDVSWVLAADMKQRGRLSASQEAERRARRLLSFVLSPTYLAVRDKLGMGVR